jgi:hypothetical protein
MAVSVMALVVASTGTSYATGLIGSDDIRNNSIQSQDIKNKTIQGKDIKNSTIGARQVKDGSLRSRYFKEGQLPPVRRAPRAPPGSVGGHSSTRPAPSSRSPAASP